MKRRTLLAASVLGLAAAGTLVLAAAPSGRDASAGAGRFLTVEPRTVNVRLIEFGEVESRQVLSVLAPISSEVTWVPDEGTLVKAGDPVLRMRTEVLETSLEEDRKANVGQEVGILCRKIQLTATEKNREAAVRRAKIDLDIAKNSLAEAKSHPTPEERRLAELNLQAARLRVERAADEEQTQRMLAAKGYVSDAKAKDARLALVRAQAELARTGAASRETLAGARPERLRALEVGVQKCEMALKRAESMAEGDVAVAREGVAVLETNYRVITDRQKNLEKQIASATVPAQAAGAVALIDVFKGGSSMSPVQVGESHTQGRELLKIAEVSSPRVVVHVSEADIARVQPGQSAEVRLRSEPGRVIRARVAQIAAFAEDKNRKLGSLALDKSGEAGVNSVDVRLDLELPEGAPIPRLGSSAEVRIIVASFEKALSVPLTSLVWRKTAGSDSQSPCLRVRRSGKVETVPVKLAAATETDAVISEGISAGDEVLLGGAE